MPWIITLTVTMLPTRLRILPPPCSVRACTLPPTLNGPMYKYNDTRFAQRWPTTGPSHIFSQMSLLLWILYGPRAACHSPIKLYIRYIANHTVNRELMLEVCEKTSRCCLHCAVRPSLIS